MFNDTDPDPQGSTDEFEASGRAASRRTGRSLGLRLLAATLAIVALGVAALLAWPEDDRREPRAEPAPIVQPAATPLANMPAVKFHAVEKPCSIIDWQPLTTVVGSATPTLVQNRSIHGGTIVVMICHARLGSPENRGQANVQISILDGSAQGMYEGLKRASVGRGQADEIDNLGQAAHSYLDPDLGPYVVAYSGNLHISVGWSYETPISGSDNITPRLAEVARQAMQRLKD